MADDLLTGLVEGLAGRRTVKMPTAWRGQFAAWQKSDRERLRQNAIQLALVFDDPQARQYLERLAEDRTEKAELRRHAVQSLLDRRPPDLVPQLRTWSEDAVLSRIAIRGLAEYDRPDTAAWLLSRWSQFTAEEKRDAIQTLVSRPAWALSLLDAIDARQIPATEIDAFAARQLQSSGNKTVADRMAKLWGQVRQTPAARVKEIERLQSLLTSPVLAKGDRQNGRRLYQETCANCHRLFGTGGQIGPDLTGSQRQNTEYLLQNLIDPSSAVVREYQMQIVETTDGRTVSGLIVDQTAAALTLQTVNEKIVLPRSEIESQSVSPQSMMPDGLTARWSVEQIRDLIAYLSGPGQVELPESDRSPAP